MAGIPFKLPVERSPYNMPGVGGATFGTPTAESGNARTVSVQMTDENGKALPGVRLVAVWLSDAATGIGVAGTAASGGMAAGTDGKLMATVVAGKYAIFQTDADGQLDVTITDAGTRTLYLAVAQTDGALAGTPVAVAFA